MVVIVPLARGREGALVLEKECCGGAGVCMTWGCEAAMPLAAVRRCGVPTLDGEGRAPQCGTPVHHGHGAVAFGVPFCGLLTSVREVRVGCGDGAPRCVCR